MEVTQTLADEHLRRELARVVSDVLPISGPLAETTRVRALSGDDLTTLSSAAHVDGIDRRIALGRFHNHDDPDVVVARRRLRTALSDYGLQHAVRLLREHHMTSAELHDHLLGISGFTDVQRTIRERWIPETDALKVASALGGLRRAATLAEGSTEGKVESDVAQRLRTAATQLAADRRLFRLDEIQVLHLMRRQLIRFDPPDVAAATSLLAESRLEDRLATPCDSGGEAMTAAANALVQRWRALGNDGTANGYQRWAAFVVLRSAEMLRQQLAPAAGPRSRTGPGAGKR